MLFDKKKPKKPNRSGKILTKLMDQHSALVMKFLSDIAAAEKAQATLESHKSEKSEKSENTDSESSDENTNSDDNYDHTKHVKQYATIIVKVDNEKERFLIDEIVPREGAKRALEGEEFEVILSDKGIPVIFKATVTKKVKFEGSICYAIPFPEKIDYCQRRSSFRVQLGAGMRKYVTLREQEKLGIEGAFINDISFTGMSIAIPKINVEEHFKEGKSVKRISFIIDEHEKFFCDINLKRVHFNEIRQQTVLAGSFENFEKEDQLKMNNFVCALEREILKQRVRK